MTSYRVVPGTGGKYLAGDDGSVWRAGSAGRPARRLPASANGSHGASSGAGRYLKVDLRLGGARRRVPVHRLVAAAWLDGFHPLLEVHHLNGNTEDNRPGNLACLTRAEHELAHGRDVPAYDVANCRLDFELRRAQEDAARLPRARHAARGIARVMARAEALLDEGRVTATE